MQGTRSRRALVLSGGGARGAYEAGVVSALFEREDFEIVCGTSIGAINAALAAQGATDRLRELWRGVPERAVIRGVSPFEEVRRALRNRRSNGWRTWRELAVDFAYAVAALRFAHPKLLRKMTHVLDPAPLVSLLGNVLDFVQLKRTLIVGVTNLTRARPEAFYGFVADEGSFERAFAEQEWASVRLSPENYLASILASAAIPLAFPKVAIAGDDGVVCDYMDGGIANNTPIRQAIDAGADEITVVIADHVALRDRANPFDHLGAIALLAQDIAQQQVLELDLKLTRRVNDAVLRGGAPGKRFVHVRTIGPSVSLPLPILGFANVETIDRAFDQGLLDGRGASEATGLSRLFATDESARMLLAGTTIYASGDRGDEMFVVVSGAVELTFGGRSVAVYEPGDVFGELAILVSGDRRASAIAKSDCIVVPVDRPRFRYLVQYVPSFAITVLRSMVAMLREMRDNGDAIDASSASPSGRPNLLAELETVHAHADVRSLVAGEPIFEWGDVCGGMFVILEGSVEIRRDGEGVVAVAHPGDVFGEMALCDQQRRTASARALTDARLASIDVPQFTSLVQSNPDFAIGVMRTMALRLLAQLDEIAT